MPSHDPQLRQIRASAGSGKTYELTTSFLKHLSGAAEAGGGPFSGCSAVHSGPHGWPEILAVTFTNRAAAEMQERIIGRLKDTALGTDKPAPGWTREQARRWVGIILRRYGALNVRTIDSLLHLIVRLTALELDLPPDFEPVFATDEAIAPLLDNLLEQSRRDERLHSLLEEACRNVFFHSPQRGFLAGETLRERVMELLLPIMGTQSVTLAHPSEITERLGAMTRDLRDAVEQLHHLLAEEKLSCSAHLARALETCRKAAPANLPPNSAMLRKACLDDCLNKASKGKASPDAERAFDAMRDIIRKWDEDGVLLRRAQTVMPFVELARELSGQVPDFLKREGAVPAAFVPRLARQVLSGDYGVPEAFCRLGTSLTHILVDEFQDTSREQWEAIHPLVLEALSRGGSLTWVGDVKQAIYGWRGGDATLFDEVRSDAELCAVAPEPRVDILPTNWRSCRAIVETNNTLFRQLSGNAACIAAEKRRIFHASSRSIFLCILHSLWNNFHANQFRHRICHRQPNGSGTTVQIQQPFLSRQLCKSLCHTIKPFRLYRVHLIKRLRRKIYSISAHGVCNCIFPPQCFCRISQNHVGFLRVTIHDNALYLRKLLRQLLYQRHQFFPNRLPHDKAYHYLSRMLPAPQIQMAQFPGSAGFIVYRNSVFLHKLQHHCCNFSK